MVNSKLIEGIFVYPFLFVIIALLVVLPILTSDAFSLFTLFFVLFPLNSHISRNNAALHAIFTQQSCLYVSKNAYQKSARISVSNTDESRFSDRVVFFGTPCIFQKECV